MTLDHDSDFGMIDSDFCDMMNDPGFRVTTLDYDNLGKWMAENDIA